MEKEADEEAEDASEQEVKDCTGYSWRKLGPSLVEHGETSFLAVQRRDSRVFDLVNLDWYRSDTVANADPTSSSTDLWLHFQCSFGKDQLAAEHSDKRDGYAEASEERVEDAAVEMKDKDFVRNEV